MRASVNFRGAIVAMTRDGIIGVDGRLPWHYREDLRRFKKRTLGCAVIMGRVTWDSLGRRELPGRRNIVLSRARQNDVEHYSAIETAIAACAGENCWFIGGAQVYRAAMPHINLLDVTTVPDIAASSGAAGVTRFPHIDFSCWKVAEKSVLPGGGGLVNVVYRRGGLG